MFSDVVRPHSPYFIDKIVYFKLEYKLKLKLTTQRLNFTVQDEDKFLPAQTSRFSVKPSFRDFDTKAV